MTYVIGSACVDVMDKSCVQECPADCIYEGARSLYINPDECVDCGACRIACRLDAIEYETDLPDDERQHIADNAAFFATVLPGLTEPWARQAAPTASGGSVSIPHWWRQCPPSLHRLTNDIEHGDTDHGGPSVTWCSRPSAESGYRRTE